MSGRAIQFRRRNASAWVSLNPVLLRGEPGVEINTGRLKIGDGTSPWTELAYVGGGESVGSGEGPQTVRLTIPHSEILTLYSTPKVLVEPTEILDYEGLPTTIPWPIACTVVGISDGGSPYVLAGTSPHMCLLLSTGEDVIIARSRRVVKVGGILADTNSDLVPDVTQDAFIYEPYVWLPSGGQAGIAAQFNEFGEAIHANFKGNLQDNGIALTMGAETGSSNPTGGDASNRFEVFLTYITLELS